MKAFLTAIFITKKWRVMIDDNEKSICSEEFSEIIVYRLENISDLRYNRYIKYLK